MKLIKLGYDRSGAQTSENLRARVNHSHAGQRFIQDCLNNTRKLASETNDRSVLLFFAMTALGKHPKGTSAVADFTALFAELGLQECAQAVRSGRYCAEDLSYFWSRDKDFSRLFEPSDIAPVEVFKTCEHARPLPRTVMFEEWDESGFHEFDTIKDPMPSKSWELYNLDNATILYDTTEFVVLDVLGRPIADLCSRFYQHVFFTSLFGEQLDRLADGHGGFADAEGVLESALMIQDMVPAPNYCHWLLDQLPRTRHLEPSHHLIMHSLAPFIQESLDAIGFDCKRVVELKKSSIVRARRLVIESSMARHWYHPCQEMSNDLVQYVRQALKVDTVADPEDRKYRNIYISRNHSDRRRISNEAELLKCLERFDFNVVYCEELSMAEQIRVFRNASVVVAPHGAGLSNTIFCKQATVVEIFNPNYGTESFRLLAQLLGFGYQHIIGKNLVRSESDRQHMGRAQLQKEDIEVDIVKLEHCLEKIFCGAGDAPSTRSSN